MSERSQKDINNMINKLFDDFVDSKFDFDTMVNKLTHSDDLNDTSGKQFSKSFKTTPNLNITTKKVTFSDNDRIENDNNNDYNSDTDSCIDSDIDSDTDSDTDSSNNSDSSDTNSTDESNEVIEDNIESENNASLFHDNSQILDFTNSFTGDLINNFTTYYKKRTGKQQNYTLLDGIDNGDPYSTNMAIEEFYYEMVKFLDEEKANSDNCKIIKYDDLDKDMTNSDELYGILINGDPVFASKSFFSLLIELTNIKNNGNANVVYDIVSLK